MDDLELEIIARTAELLCEMVEYTEEPDRFGEELLLVKLLRSIVTKYSKEKKS